MSQPTPSEVIKVRRLLRQARRILVHAECDAADARMRAESALEWLKDAKARLDEASRLAGDDPPPEPMPLEFGPDPRD